jgi:hypothetical protein
LSSSSSHEFGSLYHFTGAVLLHCRDVYVRHPELVEL